MTLAEILFGLYDRYKQDKQSTGLADVQRDLTLADNPADVSEILRTLPSYKLGEGGVHVASQLAHAHKDKMEALDQSQGVSDFTKNYLNDYGDYAKTRREEGSIPTPGDFMQQYADRFGAGVQTDKLGKRFAVSSDLLKSLGEIVNQGDLDANRVQKIIDASTNKEARGQADKDFFGATARLLEPSTSPAEIAANKSRGGFSPPGQTIGDVLSAASDYGPSDKSVSDILARVIAHGNDTYPEASRRKVTTGTGPGSTTESVLYNLFGKPAAEGAHSTVPSKITDPNKDKDKLIESLQKEKDRIIANPGLYPNDVKGRKLAISRVNGRLKALGVEVKDDEPAAAPAKAEYVYRDGKMVKQ
jgi:hypothetical protein